MKRLDNRDGFRQWVYNMMGGISSKPWSTHTPDVARMIDRRLRFKLLNVYNSCLYYADRRGLG